MKKLVLRLMVAAVACVGSAPALADETLEGPTCREWLANPHLGAQQWVIGYAVGYDWAQVIHEKTKESKLYSVSATDLFNLIEEQCKSAPSSLRVQDVFVLARRDYEHINDARERKADEEATKRKAEAPRRAEWEHKQRK